MVYIILASIIIYITYKLFSTYKSKINHKKSLILYSLFSLVIFWLVIMIVRYPKNSVNSALNGIDTWLNIVFPSLLPFFIVSEILIGLGIVSFISILLEPLTTFLFNVPGEGSFVFAMSVTSGYPVGAKLVSDLRKKNKVSKVEAQRILSFSSTSGPLFMIGAVSIGMFNNPNIGPLIATSHYLSALTLGLIFRFYNTKKYNNYKIKFNGFKYAFNKMIETKKKDGRSIGELLKDAVINSVNTMLMIGGFIILYSVIIELFSISNIFSMATDIMKKTFPTLGSEPLMKGLMSGFIEITIGCKNIASLDSINYVIKVAIASLLIGWSGLSIHSQVISFISGTGVSTSLYILSKAIHGFLASVYTILLYNFFIDEYIQTSKIINYVTPTNFVQILNNWFYIIKFSLKLLSFTLITIIVLSLIISIFKKNR